jgi:alcohol dehydrogenase class IV
VVRRGRGGGRPGYARDLSRFSFKDGERVIHFGRGIAAEAVDLLGGPGYTLLTTERAAAAAPHVAEAASAVHLVPDGLVDDLAADMLEEVRGDRIVALGGGRPVDVAKALVSALGAGRAMAIPTTLSGAEMSRGHRLARGVPAGTPYVRPAVVVNDPSLSASQPLPDLAASALNALAHAVEGPCTIRANPIATLAAHEAARLLTGDLEDRDSMALGALLAGYALDSQGFGLHHVLAQTLVRVAGMGHGEANAVLLPHTIRALARRCDVDESLIAHAERMRDVAGARLQADEATLDEVVEAAARRESHLAQTPPPASRAEVRDILTAAWES